MPVFIHIVTRDLHENTVSSADATGDGLTYRLQYLGTPLCALN